MFRESKSIYISGTKFSTNLTSHGSPMKTGWDVRFFVLSRLIVIGMHHRFQFNKKEFYMIAYHPFVVIPTYKYFSIAVDLTV